MAMGEGGGEKEAHLFLEEPTWENLPGDRVRCVQTGHEMPLAAQALYASTKKCRAALFESALVKRRPPLNFFEQSKDSKDKIVCKLTGVVLNKKEEAVWKHMLGKKFEHKLAEKEAQKEKARKDVEMKDNGVDQQHNETSSSAEKRKGKGKEQSLPARVEEPVKEDEDDRSDSEKSDFWVPPAGDRWDFDSGTDDRWCSPSHAGVNGHRVVAEPLDALDAEDVEMLDGEEILDGDESSEEESQKSVRTKRTTPKGRTGPHKSKRKKTKRASTSQ